MVVDKKKTISCTLVGNPMVGKTSIARSFVGTHAEEEYSATVFENYAGNTCVADDRYIISIYDSAGQHDYANMRAFTYMTSDVTILCYKVSDRESFEQIKLFWIPEVRRFKGKMSPIFLVATQTDKRSQCYPNSVRKTEGEQLAKDIKAEEFMETSTNNPEQIKDMFDKVVKTALKHRRKKFRIVHRIFGRL